MMNIAHISMLNSLMEQSTDFNSQVMFAPSLMKMVMLTTIFLLGDQCQKRTRAQNSLPTTETLWINFKIGIYFESRTITYR